MIERVIELSQKHRWVVFGVALAMALWAYRSIRETPLDAVPDLTDPQVIVFTEWMGRSPDLVEDQITYPLVTALESTPGAVTVRGYSMFGMSFVYVIFDDDTDLYWARSRVLEYLGRAQLPPDAAPALGPDATGVGWIYQYVLEDTSGKLDLARLRELQDFSVRPALAAVHGVAEVASFGGFERQYQIVIDPARLAAFGVTLAEVTRAVRDANSEVGARVLELAGREYVIRGRGYVTSLEDLEKSVIAVGKGGTPVRLDQVARARFGPEIRRGAGDLDGQGDAVGGIVVMRFGSNALQVIDALEEEMAALRLPEGVRLRPTYDRSELIEGSIATLRTTLLEEAAVVVLVCLLFLFHARSAVVAMIVLPLSVLLAFIPMYYLGLTANIMSLGGIAIAIGELADASIVLIENAHVRLAEAGPGADRKRIVIDAAKEVGGPIFFSLLIITVSFLPIFTLAGQAGRLFKPLAYTKTFAMLAASILSVTLAPPLMVLLLRGRFRKEEEHPVNRFLGRIYRPIVRAAVRFRRGTIAVATLVLAGTVPLLLSLGSEFMPPLDEGSLLVMPTTFPGISIEEARRALSVQDRIIKSFPEVASAHGKVGRAETATDPAQLDMNETVVMLRPKAEWPAIFHERWHTGVAPEWLAPALRRVWPEHQPRTIDELARDIADAASMPGYQMAVAPPIRTRIDMLTTGVRTPAGVKVFGPDLAVIERVAVDLEGLLRRVPGTRSTFAERQTGREYIDVVPDRDAVSRYGLTVRDVHDAVESAVGGMTISTAVAGRARYGIHLRYGSDFRADPEGLRSLLLPVPPAVAVFPFEADGSGSGRASVLTAGVMPSGATMDDAMGGPKGGPSTSMPASGGATMNGERDTADAAAPWLQAGASVPLGELADVRVTTGPPMIKDENGTLVGYVFADIDTAARDLGGWVDDAKALVSAQLALPDGYRLQWTGQYEHMAEMQGRLAYVLPVTIVLIVVLLYMSLRAWPQTLLVLMSLPFALAGSVWLLALRGYNLSTATWVGIVAVGGVAAQTGIVLIVYLDQAWRAAQDKGLIKRAADVDALIVETAASRARPLVMTVATTVLGLAPLLWESGVGADVSARTAAPVVGGLWSCMFLTLLVLPAAYAMWRRRQLSRESQ